MFEITRSQLLAAPIEEVFAFFDRPENLAAITPDWMGFRIITPHPIPMHRGAIIDYAIRLGPVPTRWRSMITTYEPPHCFVDEQLTGPYSFWHHTHRFEEMAGGTLVRDHVRYLMPYGVFGSIAHRLVVRRTLEAIFDHRVRVVAEKFGAGEGDRS